VRDTQSAGSVRDEREAVCRAPRAASNFRSSKDVRTESPTVAMLRALTALSLALFVLVLIALASQLPERPHSHEVVRLTTQPGLPTPRAPALRPCTSSEAPPPEDHERSACRFVVRNHQMENVELLYYDGTSERRYWIIDYNSSFVSLADCFARASISHAPRPYPKQMTGLRRPTMPCAIFRMSARTRATDGGSDHAMVICSKTSTRHAAAVLKQDP
jgi:hypothetical protein